MVVEDNGPNPEDRRLCVCLDGGPGTTLADWKIFMKQQRALEGTEMLPLKAGFSASALVFRCCFFATKQQRSELTVAVIWVRTSHTTGQGWVFLRMWEAQWAVDRSGCEKVLARACSDAGVRSGLGFDPDHAASPLRSRSQAITHISGGGAASAGEVVSPVSSDDVVRPSAAVPSNSAHSLSAGLYDDEDVKLLTRQVSVGAGDSALGAVAAKKTRKATKTSSAASSKPQKSADDPVASMTVPALREALRELDQDTSGRKADLVDRLRAAKELEDTNGAIMADFVVGAGAPKPKPQRRQKTAKRKQSTKAKKPAAASKKTKRTTAGNRGKKKKRDHDAWVPSDDDDY